MKHLKITFLLVIFYPTYLVADTITEERVNKAAVIIEQAVAAYGGKDTLKQLNSIVVEHKTVGYSVQQSRKPDAPWDKYDSRGTTGINLEDDAFVAVNSGASGGFEFNTVTVVNGEESYQVDKRAGTAQQVLEPNFNATSGPFVRVTPALLVSQLVNRAHTAFYLGEVKHQRRKHDVVGFSMEVGPAIALFFDQKTHMLSHSERVLPGIGLVAYEFLDYEDIEGIPFNRRFELWVNGDLDSKRTNISTIVNKPITELSKLDASLTITDPIPPTPMSHSELADGVHLIGGNGTYAMFVELRDFIVAIGGTAGSEQRIEKLREVLPEKPIRYGVRTHHHSDHIVAVPNYIENGATIIAAKAHEKTARAAAGKEKIDLETVKDKKVITDGTLKIELLDIGPTAHTEHLLVAWLPDQGIPFEADHFGLPAAGPVRPAVSSTRSFAKALKKHKLKPEIFVSAHSPRTANMKHLKEALRKKVASK